jgi:hypothetical protein
MCGHLHWRPTPHGRPCCSFRAVRNSGRWIVTTTKRPLVRNTSPSNTRRSLQPSRLARQAIDTARCEPGLGGSSVRKAKPLLLIFFTLPVPCVGLSWPRSENWKDTSASSGKRRRLRRSLLATGFWFVGNLLAFSSPVLFDQWGWLYTPDVQTRR